MPLNKPINHLGVNKTRRFYTLKSINHSLSSFEFGLVSWHVNLRGLFNAFPMNIVEK